MRSYWDSSRAAILERAGSMEQLAPTRRFTYCDGRSKSVEAIEVETGAGLSFTVLVDRCLDIADARWRGRSLSWQSPAGVVSPAFYEKRGTGWLRGYGGGLFVTCGLRNAGPPSPPEDGEAYGQHGEISNTPAENVAVRKFWEGERYLIEIQGDVREAYPFGPNLRLHRILRTEFGASWIDLEDVVTNEGFRPELHMQLYHWNFGFPLVDEGTRLELSTDVVAPRDEAAARGLSVWNRFEAPATVFMEQIFYHSYSAEPPETTTVRILPGKEDSDWRVELSYPSRLLPELAQWKCCRKGDYVLGIEPGNCLPVGRAAHRARRDTVLEPGSSVSFKSRFRVFTNGGSERS